ncbi:MAG: hypothetical protein RJA36_891 [Pseudomonadota bacterium]|jgi:hypothetical protein
MADTRASEILDMHARMANQREHFEKVWDDIAERVAPRKAEFKRRNTAQTTKGKQRTEKMFDAVPALALDRFAAAFHSLVTPRNQQWHKVKTANEELAEDTDVQRYLDEVNRRLFAARYAGNFDNQVHECYFDAGAFGTMGLFVADMPGQKILYRSVPIDQLFIAENEHGQVDVVHRYFWMTARQAYRKWGDKLPGHIKTAAERTPDAEFPFLHCVKPREDLDVRRMDYRGMPFASYFVCVDSRMILGEGGFRVFPYCVGRYSVTAGEVYGRSPMMTALPDVKMLNEMNKTTMQAAQLAVLPPMLAARDGILDAIRLTPAAINYGGVDDQGRQMLQPLRLGENLPVSIELMDQKRKVVQDALWNTLFQILVDNPSMTATEAMLRAQEKGALLAPTASRTESEFLNPMITRELQLLEDAGMLPEKPEKLQGQAFIEVEYTSPLELARRAQEGVAILRAVEQLAPLAQVLGPEAYKRVNVDEASKVIFEVNGVPSKVLYSDDEMAAIDEQKAQQAEMQQVLQAAPVAASAARDLAQASALSQGMPNQSSILPDPGA